MGLKGTFMEKKNILEEYKRLQKENAFYQKLLDKIPALISELEQKRDLESMKSVGSNLHGHDYFGLSQEERAQKKSAFIRDVEHPNNLETSGQTHTDHQIQQALKELRQLNNVLICQSLSKREKEILKLISEGLTDSEIGERLFISPATARTHRHNIIQKTGVRNTASLVRLATECGLCD
jgi:DNA-binding CsgD family transcriptional regulator